MTPSDAAHRTEQATGIPQIGSYRLPGPAALPPQRVGWTPDPARAALLIHDMQHYFLRSFSPELPPLPQVVANIAALRDVCARLGVPVAYTAQPGSMSPADRGLLADFWGPGMRASAADRLVVPELAPEPDDLVVTKWRYSAFHRTGLLSWLRENGRSQLVICGVYAHLGCLITAFDAYSHDIQPFLVADGVADMSPEWHRQALAHAAEGCAATPTTGQVLAALAEAVTR